MSLVSIIIPTYNRAHLIDVALDSLIAQTHQNWECIIVDDGGDDSTPEIISKYIERDSRFSFEIRPSTALKGASSCRNIGASFAKGDYLIFLDSDDKLLPDCIANRLLTIKEHSDNYFWVFPMLIEDSYGKTQLRRIPDHADYLREFLSNRLHWGVMCTIWKKSFFDKINGFNALYPRLNDPEIHIRAMLKSEEKFKVLASHSPDSVYIYPNNVNKFAVANKYCKSLLLFVPEIVIKLKNAKKNNLIKDLKHYVLDYTSYHQQFVGEKSNLKIYFVFWKTNVISFPQYVSLNVSYFFYLMSQRINKQFRNSIVNKLEA